jgi:hypothetical protein
MMELKPTYVGLDVEEIVKAISSKVPISKKAIGDIKKDVSKLLKFYMGNIGVQECEVGKWFISFLDKSPTFCISRSDIKRIMRIKTKNLKWAGMEFSYGVVRFTYDFSDPYWDDTSWVVDVFKGDC